MANKSNNMTSRSFSRNRAKEGEEQFLHPEGLKRWKGQHFLTDRSVLQKEAEALQCEGKSVIEIGAGDGRLSKFILRQKPSALTAVELDKKWVAHLRKKLSGYKQVTILQQDAMELPDGFKVDCVIGNIPYYITSPLLVKLGKWKFKRAVLCVQKEVADRLVAQPGSSTYGRMSIFAQLHFEMEPIANVPRTSFHPIPQVDSAVVAFKPRKGSTKLPANLETTSAALFSHRLADVSNAVFHSRHIWGWDKPAAREMSRSVKYGQRKVLTLTPAEVLELAQALPVEKKKAPRHQAAGENEAANSRRRTD